MENKKEEMKKILLETIKKYYQEYPKLPPMQISDEEIESLFDVIEAHFLVHNIMHNYSHVIIIIIRRALSLATIENSGEFNINHISMALKDLSAFNIPNDEIKAMQNELTTRSNKYVLKKYK